MAYIVAFILFIVLIIAGLFMYFTGYWDGCKECQRLLDNAEEQYNKTISLYREMMDKMIEEGKSDE